MTYEIICPNKRIKNITGKKFGKLTVIGISDKKYKHGGILRICRCDCGKEILVPTARLSTGNTKSCGCTRKQKGRNSGSKNGMWKGNRITVHALHDWVRDHKPKPDLCESCKQDEPYDLANISQEYKRDINDFEWLCRKCHMTKDGRFNELKRYSLKYRKLLQRDNLGRYMKLK